MSRRQTMAARPNCEAGYARTRTSGYKTDDDPAHKDTKKQFSLVQCGSSSLTSAQGNYATIELECLAIQYALSKSKFYLRGLPNFMVWTDHRPLAGIFNKALHTLNNQRLIRIREKLLDFSLTVILGLITTSVPGS